MHLTGISNKLAVSSQCSTLKEALTNHTLLAVLTSCLEHIVGLWSSISMPYLALEHPTLWKRSLSEVKYIVLWIWLVEFICIWS